MVFVLLIIIFLRNPFFLILQIKYGVGEGVPWCKRFKFKEILNVYTVLLLIAKISLLSSSDANDASVQKRSFKIYFRPFSLIIQTID